jgi:hypothetical protein
VALGDDRSVLDDHDGVPAVEVVGLRQHERTLDHSRERDAVDAWIELGVQPPVGWPRDDIGLRAERHEGHGAMSELGVL